MRLRTSTTTRPLYESLSFTPVSDWEVAILLRPAGSGSPNRGRAQHATGALKEAAMQFEASQDCSGRPPGSLMSMFPDALCVVTKSMRGNAIDAAAWVHLAFEDKQTEGSKVWIAPAIARSTSLARELISGVIAIWEEQNPSYSSTQAACLSLKRTRDGESEELFTSLGFSAVRSTPLMRKGLGNNQLPRFLTPPLTYFCLARYHRT